MAQASTASVIINFAFQLIAGLGAFLIAVKILSDTMNQLAGVGLKKLFSRLGSKKLAGVGLGALTAGVLHSSSVTTAMVVGLVNAGVMVLSEATTIIMGANIGTTFTALVAALGASFDFMAYATVLTFIGIFMNSLAKTEKTKTFGYMLAGLGLIFVALQFMDSAVATLKQHDQIMSSLKSFIASVSGDSLGNNLLMVLVGVALTAALQSSTAVTTILISMADVFCVVESVSGAYGISNAVLFIILGSNIGTCVTTLISGMGTNRDARRAALVHLLFNVLGTLIFFVLLSVWSSFTTDTLNVWFDGKPALQIAVFHTIFNVCSTAIFLPFTHLLVKLVCVILPEKPIVPDGACDLKFIDDRFLPTPSIAVQQSKQEVARIGELTLSTCDVAMKAFIDGDTGKESEVMNGLKNVALLNDKLVQYLVKISANSTTTEHSEGTISGLYYVLGDIMRIGDLSTNILKYTDKVASGEISFSEGIYPEISAMYQSVRSMYDVAIQCFLTKDESKLAEVEKMETAVDETRKRLVEAHIERLNKGECNPASNGVYINLVGNLERMADHITFIAESINKHPDTTVS